MEALVTNSSDMFVVLDKSGLEVSFVSPAVRRLLGHRPDVFVGTQLSSLVHPEDQEAVRIAVDQSDETPQTVEFRLESSSHRWLWFDGHVTDQQHDPFVGGVVINAREASERRRAQSQLTQSEARSRRWCSTPRTSSLCWMTWGGSSTSRLRPWGCSGCRRMS